jgi:hypothetical protein
MPAVRLKVDLDADNKANPMRRSLRSGQVISVGDKEAKKLVDGGFADELDERGNIKEEGEPSNQQPGEAAAATGSQRTVPGNSDSASGGSARRTTATPSSSGSQSSSPKSSSTSTQSSAQRGGRSTRDEDDE